jgi:hypothetical protein
VKSSYDYQFAKPALRWLFNDYYGDVSHLSSLFTHAPCSAGWPSWGTVQSWGTEPTAAAGPAGAPAQRRSPSPSLSPWRLAANTAGPQFDVTAPPRLLSPTSPPLSPSPTQPIKTPRAPKGLNSVLYFAPSADPRVSVKAKMGSGDAGEWGPGAAGRAGLLSPAPQPPAPGWGWARGPRTSRAGAPRPQRHHFSGGCLLCARGWPLRAASGLAALPAGACAARRPPPHRAPRHHTHAAVRGRHPVPALSAAGRARAAVLCGH